MYRSGAPALSICLFGLAAGLAACRKDNPPPKWDVGITAPLVKTSLTIGDLVPDSMLSQDSEGRISILYSTVLFSLSLDTVLNIPDTSFRYAYALPFPGPIDFQPGASFNATDDVTHFDLQDLQLSRLIVRSGQLDVAITNMMNGNIIGEFALPGASLSGTPFAVQMQLPPGTPAAPSSTFATRALDGYLFDLRGPAHNAVNALATHLSYANSAAGPAVSITDQDSLLAVVSYHGIVPQYATGYFGMRHITVAPATADLGLFSNISGTINLAQASAALRVRNGIGVDARADIHYISAVNTRTGQSVDLAANITTAPLNINRAIDLGGHFQEATTTFNLNGTNSNLLQFLNNLPDRLGYALDITVNPLGNVGNGHDFLYHDSKLTAELDVDIPLRLIASDLALRKVIDLDLPGTAQAHAWRSGTLHLFADNGFPFSASVQLAVADAGGQPLSPLTPGGTIASGTLGTDGTVDTPVSSRLDFHLTAQQMDLLHQTGKLQVVAAFNTADQVQHVQILERYRMDLQLTVQADYTVNGDE